MPTHVGNVCDSITVSRRKQACGDTLLTAAQSGDAAAFGELSRQHSRRILHRLYRMLGTWEEAEDVLQESLLKAFVHLAQFQARSSFSTWLTSIAINSALMVLRKRRTGAEVSLDRTEDDPDAWRVWDITDNSIGPEAEYASRECREILRKVTRRLSRRERHVVELYHGQERSLNEVAEALGISAAAAKSRLLRARLTLRKLLVRSSQIPSFHYIQIETSIHRTSLGSRSFQKFIAAD